MAFIIRRARLWEFTALKETLDTHIRERRWYEKLLERWKPFCPHCHERTWWDHQTVQYGEKVYVGYRCSQCGLICAQNPENKYDSMIFVTERIYFGTPTPPEFYPEYAAQQED